MSGVFHLLSVRCPTKKRQSILGPSDRIVSLIAIVFNQRRDRYKCLTKLHTKFVIEKHVKLIPLEGVDGHVFHSVAGNHHRGPERRMMIAIEPPKKLFR